MPYGPLFYNKLNFLDNTFFPNTQKRRNNLSYAYWERSLFQRACSVFEFELPDEWSGNVKDFFYYCLYRFGYVCVLHLPKYGMIFQPCSLKGYNIYYQPTEAIITNKAFTMSENNIKHIIGENCELIKLTPDYLSAWDIISYYAEKLSSLDAAIAMSIECSKAGFLLGAKTKAAAESLKKMMDKISRGECCVIYDTKLVTDDPVSKDSPFQYWDRKLKENYITSDQLNDFQTILNNFDAEIGIKTIPYQKKERLVTSEAESRMIDSAARSIVWYETLSSSIEKVNHMFNTDIKVRLRYDETETNLNEGYKDNGMG